MEIFKRIARHVCSGYKDATCSSEMHALLLACLACTTPKATASRRAKCLHARTRWEKGRKDPISAEIVLHWSVKKKEKKKKKGGKRVSMWGCGIVRKSRVTHKNDRAIDAHHELHTTSASTSINRVLATHNYYRYRWYRGTEKDTHVHHVYMCVCAFMYV